MIRRFFLWIIYRPRNEWGETWPKVLAMHILDSTEKGKIR